MYVICMCLFQLVIVQQFYKVPWGQSISPGNMDHGNHIHWQLPKEWPRCRCAYHIIYVYVYVCMYVFIYNYMYIYIYVVLWDCVQGADPLRSSILVFYISCLTCVYLCILQQQSSYHGNPQQPRKRWCFGDFLWAVLVAKLPRYRVKIRYLKVAWY
jgi:hypothetical protein